VENGDPILEVAENRAVAGTHGQARQHFLGFVDGLPFILAGAESSRITLCKEMSHANGHELGGTL
jgi:hypothetical protein